MTTKTFKFGMISALIAVMIVPAYMMNGSAISENANPQYPEIAVDVSHVTAENEFDIIPKELHVYQQIKMDRNNLIEQMKDAEGVDKTNLQAQINELNQNMAKRQKFVEDVTEKLKVPSELIKKFNTAINELDQAKSSLPDDIVYYIDHADHKLVISTDSNDTDLSSKIISIVGKGVPFTIQDIPRVDYVGCVDRNDCDPHVAGMTFNANGRTATISSPVNIGWFDDGYISAGHALITTPVNDPVYHDGSQIGTIQTRIFSDYGACDCMYIDKTTGTWSYSNYYNTPSNSIDIPSAAQPAVNDWVLISGMFTYTYGKITATGITVVGEDAYGNDVHTVGTYKVQNVPVTHGDSGAPVVNLFTDKYNGLVSAGDGTHTYIIPWNTVKTGLSLPTNPFD